MEIHSGEETILEMRLSLQQACRLAATASPEALDRCLPLLSQVRARLYELVRRPPPAFCALRRLEALRRDLERFARLVEGAARFHAGWARVRDCRTRGYDARGGPAPGGAGSRVSVEL